MKISLIIIFTTSLSLSNLHAQPKLTESKKNEIGDYTRELKNSNNEFGFNLFTKIYSQYDNIIISPFSIYSALLIASAGSENETEKEFEKVMQMGSNKFDYYKKYQFITDQYNTFLNTERSKIAVNSSLWVGSNIKLKPEYVNLIEYYSLIENNQINYSENFIDSREEINEWVNVNTDEEITDFLSENEVTKEPRIIILNTLDFYSEWAHVFELKNTHDDFFYISENDSVQVSFIHKYDFCAFSENEEFQCIELLYSRRRSSMCILYPKNEIADISIENLANTYDTLISSMEKKFLILDMPKFNFQTHLSLKQPLMSLGFEKAFDSRADFSGMTSATVKIADVIHESFIDVNEKGTSAGAATAVLYDAEYTPDIRKIKINRPFLFIIKDDLTDTILFIGKYAKPD